MKSLLIFLVLCFALPAAAGDDREALHTLLEEFLAGASINDAAVHDRFWAEDLVYTSSSGERYGKSEIMAGLVDADDSQAETGAETPDYSAQDVEIRTYGETAVMTFRLVAEQEDQPAAEYFNTGVFRSREDGWKAVAWQATHLAGQED